MQFFSFFLEIATTTLPVAIVHMPYVADPIVALGPSRCTQNNVHFRVAYGELPAGMRLTAGGYLTGTPSQTGLFRILVRAGNDCEYATQILDLKVDGSPILTTHPDHLEFEHTIDGPVPPPQTLLVSSTWSDLPYSADSIESPWLKAEVRRGRTELNGGGLSGDAVSIRVDPQGLAAGTYHGVVRLAAWRAANTPSIPVILKIHAPK